MPLPLLRECHGFELASICDQAEFKEWRVVIRFLWLPGEEEATKAAADALAARCREWGCREVVTKGHQAAPEYLERLRLRLAANAASE